MMPRAIQRLLTPVPSSITQRTRITGSHGLALQVRVVNNILGLLMDVGRQELRQQPHNQRQGPQSPSFLPPQA